MEEAESEHLALLFSLQNSVAFLECIFSMVEIRVENS